MNFHTAIIEEICFAFNMGDEEDARKALREETDITIREFVEYATRSTWLSEVQLRRLFGLSK